MKVGDLVMFKHNNPTYSKWFGGELGIVISYTAKAQDGHAHCRVQWVRPVKYFKSWTTSSDFKADNYEVVNESRRYSNL